MRQKIGQIESSLFQILIHNILILIVIILISFSRPPSSILLVGSDSNNNSTFIQQLSRINKVVFSNLFGGSGSSKSARIQQNNLPKSTPEEQPVVHQHRLIYDHFGNRLNLTTNTPYAIINRATKWPFKIVDEQLNISDPIHWKRFESLAEDSTNQRFIYKLGSDIPNESGEGSSFYHVTQVSIRHVLGHYYHLLTENCPDERPGLKYFSARNDFLKGTYCGLYEAPADGNPYSWSNFEYYIISKSDYRSMLWFIKYFKKRS